MRIIVDELIDDENMTNLGVVSVRKVVEIDDRQLIRLGDKYSELKNKDAELSTQQRAKDADRFARIFNESSELSAQQRVKAAALVIRDFCKQHVSCKICPFSLNTNDKDNQARCPFYNTIPAKWYEEGDN